MNCADVRLDELMDGELDAPAAAEVEKHLASCAECRAELERSRRLEALLQKSAPGGAAPDTDRFLRVVQSRSRRSGGWMFAVAAVLLAGIVAVIASSLGGKPVDVRQELARYTQKQDAGEAEARIRSAGPAAIPVLEEALGDADVRLQVSAATLLFKVLEPEKRKEDKAAWDRVVARFQSRPEKGTWTLMPVGTEAEDADIVPIAVSMAVDGQERWAMDVLKRLHRLDAMAREKVLESVVTLLHSDNPRIQKLALDIVKELKIRFPLMEIVELLDSPELGDAALDFLREQTGKDFKKDKNAWRKSLQREEGL